MVSSIAPALALLGQTPDGAEKARKIYAWSVDVDLERFKESLNPSGPRELYIDQGHQTIYGLPTHSLDLWWDTDAMVHQGPKPANRKCPGDCLECELRDYCGMDTVGRARPDAAHNLDDYIYTRLADVGRDTFDEGLLWWDATSGLFPNAHYGPRVLVSRNDPCTGCIFCNIKWRLLFLKKGIISWEPLPSR